MKTIALLLLSCLTAFGQGMVVNPYRFATGGGGASPTPEILWTKFSDGSGGTATSAVGPNLTLGATTAAPTWITGKSGSGNALQFDGSNDTLSSASAVTYAVNKITICFWLWWDAFANDDKLAMESSANFNSVAGTFIVNPNDSSTHGGGSFGIVMSDGSTVGAVTYTRPSAAAWHHYAIVFDRSTSTGNIKLYLDGSLATPNNVYSSSFSASANFTAQTLYVMQRGNSSLFGAGRMDDLRIYNREITSGEVTQIVADAQ